MIKRLLLVGLLLAAQPALAAKAPGQDGPPARLSDLYKFFLQNLRKGLGTEVQSGNIRIQGRSWELLASAKFPEVELPLKPFSTQGLSFEKAEMLFRNLELDRAALLKWDLKVVAVREVQTRLIFSLRSLQKKLSEAAGKELKVAADVEEQSIVLSGPGSFGGLACNTVIKLKPKWDEASRQLTLQAFEKSYGGHKVPGLFWFLGKDGAPLAPVLDFSGSWIPFNIQEVHVGWDRVNLSTNW